MILYATEFPTKSGTSIQRFLTICAQWLSGSQWYPFKDLGDIEFPEDEIVDLSRAGHDLHVAGLVEAAGRRAGVRHAIQNRIGFAGRQTSSHPKMRPVCGYASTCFARS